MSDLAEKTVIHILPGHRPRGRDTRSCAPLPRNRDGKRLTRRTLLPSRATASRSGMLHSVTCCITPTRSTSMRPIVRFPSNLHTPSTQRGYFRIVRRGHYCFGLTSVEVVLPSVCRQNMVFGRGVPHRRCLGPAGFWAPQRSPLSHRPGLEAPRPDKNGQT